MADVTGTGTVSHHFSKGIRVQEAGDYGKRFTVWTDERPAIGSTVTVTGRLGAKLEEHDGKNYVALSVNNPTIQASTDAPTATGPQDAVQPAGDWNTRQSGGYHAAGVDQWANNDSEGLPF